jgi:hypothetical protein
VQAFAQERLNRWRAWASMVWWSMLALLPDSTYGFMVGMTEVVLFAPLFVFAVRPNHLTWILVPVWCVAAWLLVSGDPLREAALGMVLRDRTEYAPRILGTGIPKGQDRAVRRRRSPHSGQPDRRVVGLFQRGASDGSASGMCVGLFRG